MCSNAYANIKKAFSFVIDFVFPTTCLGCSEGCEKSSLCSRCQKEIYLLSGLDVCSICGEPFEREIPASCNNLCYRCLGGRFCFESARSIAYYRGVLKTFLQRFKYNRRLSYGTFLCGMLDSYFPFCDKDFDMVIPVPLHVNKLRKREFNQSAVFSVHIAKKIGVAYEPFVLKKVKETLPQVDLKKEEHRIKNVRKAFAVSNPRMVKGARILLVDDVFTTGSTTDECSRVLVNAGAKSVNVFTLTRACLNM